VYLNRFFFQLFGDAEKPPEKAWWKLTHIEIRMNRTYNGHAYELIGLVRDLLRTRKVGPAGGPGDPAKKQPPEPNLTLPTLTRAMLDALPPPQPLPAARPKKRRKPAARPKTAVVYFKNPKKKVTLPGQEIVAVWDGRLADLVRRVTRDGKRLVFHFDAMRTKVRVVEADYDGNLKVSAPGVQMSVVCSRLSFSDRKDLAVAVAEADPAGHAIAAFYLQALGKGGAKRHLRLAVEAAKDDEAAQEVLKELAGLFP
jgi:hypothetical protein